MNQFKLFTLIAITIFLSSCAILKEGFKNQKKNSSDEFLVEKKSPLVMPPDYNELPIPKEDNIDKESSENKIKSLISKKKYNDIEGSTIEKNKTLEDSLLKKIKDN